MHDAAFFFPLYDNLYSPVRFYLSMLANIRLFPHLCITIIINNIILTFQ